MINAIARIEKHQFRRAGIFQGYDLRTSTAFKDGNVPIARSYYERLSGRENAEAADCEADELSERFEKDGTPRKWALVDSEKLKEMSNSKVIVEKHEGVTRVTDK